jgi:NH3-dependent NAD+ synthetase
MSGGLAVISDVPKEMVYDLARYMNREREVIPPASIEKPPSAELRPNQVDQDTLPPYPVLDGILEGYIEDGLSLPELVAAGYDPEVVRWVTRTVDRNEYKRKQARRGYASRPRLRRRPAHADRGPLRSGLRLIRSYPDSQ